EVAYDPLHVVSVDRGSRARMMHAQVLLTGHLPTGKLFAIGVACEVCAVAVRNGESRTWRNAHLGDELGEPIQAESRYEDAFHAVVVIKWQGKWKEPAPRQSADREFSDGEFSGSRGAGEIAAVSHVRCLAIGAAKGLAIHVNGSEGEKRRVAALDRRKICAALLRRLRLDRRQFRKRNQDVTNSANDLLLLRGGELGQTKRLFLHFHLTGATQRKLVVRLDRDCRQNRD